MVQMIVEFLEAYPSHTIMEVYEMPAQIFFIFYKKIINVFALRRITYIESHLLAKAKQWADKKNQHKVDIEYNKIKRLAEGN